MDRLGDPHLDLKGSLVAGTNGKGSVCATLDSISRAAGCGTTMLIKPHLRSWTERIVQDGVAISEERFADLATAVMAAAATLPDELSPTGFEVVTAMGFLEAAEAGSDVVICEVGVGGRLDSTNVADLGVGVITNIGLDHTDILGGTLEQISAEKAGIIKHGNVVVTGAVEPALSVIRARALDVEADLFEVSEGHTYRRIVDAPRQAISLSLPSKQDLTLATPLAGPFQAANLAVAARAAIEMGFAPEAIKAGASGVSWPGRMQWLSRNPDVLVDGAHNPPAMQALHEALPGAIGHRRVVAVFGAMSNKLLEPMLKILKEITSEVVFTQLDVERAAPPRQLAQVFGEGVVEPTLQAALERAIDMAGDEGVTLVCGSLALVGAVISDIQRSAERSGPSRTMVT